MFDFFRVLLNVRQTSCLLECEACTVAEWAPRARRPWTTQLNQLNLEHPQPLVNLNEVVEHLCCAKDLPEPRSMLHGL